jgi:hypothetical protein
LRQALNLPPSVELHGFSDRTVVDHAVPIRFQVTNGLTETVGITSQKGTVLSKRLRVRDGAAAVRWVPRRPGRFGVRVSVRGIDGSLSTDRATMTVGRGPPAGGPTLQLGALPREPVVGRALRIQFRVTNAAAETLRIESTRAGGLTWHRQVRTGRGAINWIPQQAGPVRLRIVVRGADGHTVEQSTPLTVRKRSSRSGQGP